MNIILSPHAGRNGMSIDDPAGFDGQDSTSFAEPYSTPLIEEALEELATLKPPQKRAEPAYLLFTDDFMPGSISFSPEYMPITRTGVTSDAGDKARQELWEGKDPIAAITIDGVKQGGWGDCIFMSTLASMANTEEGRKLISNMIAVNSDGSYTVHFPGDRNAPITVDTNDISNGHSRSDQSMWATVLECAYVEYVKTSPGVGWLQLEDFPTVSRSMTSVGTMTLLTGAPSATDLIEGVSIGSRTMGIGSTSLDNIGRDLEDAMKNGLIVTAGVAPALISKLQGADPFRGPGPLVPQHQYSVIGYDAATKTVKVRNPWGRMPGELSPTGATVDGITHHGDGVITMSLDTFAEHFDSVHFSNSQPTLHAAQNVIDTVRDRNDAAFAAIIGAVTGDPRAVLAALHEANTDTGVLLRELLYLGTNAYASEVLGHPLRTVLAMNPSTLLVASILDEFFQRHGGQFLNELAAGGDKALHAVTDRLAELGQPIAQIWSGAIGRLGRLLGK